MLSLRPLAPFIRPNCFVARRAGHFGILNGAASLTLTLINLFFTSNAFAEPPSGKITSSFQSESGNAGLSSSNSSSATRSVLSFDGTTGSKFSHSVIRFGVDQLSPDYSRNIITDKIGNLTPLAKYYSGNEYVTRAGYDYFNHEISVETDAATTASSTPYSGSTAQIKTSYDAYAYGSKYSLTLARSDHSAPTSYFINPDNFQTEMRATRNLENRVTIGLEQIIAENAKIKIELFNIDRPESRPAADGAEAQCALAINDQSALLAKLGYTQEHLGTLLYDDRGALKASWAQFEYRVLPNYRWSVSAIFDTILETEAGRGTTPEQKIGTDSIGAIIRTHRKSWDLGFNAISSFSNTSYRQFSAGVDFTWQI